MQFNMSHPVDIFFNTYILKFSEYALMRISSSQAVNLAFVVFEVFVKNSILLQDLQAWNCRSAELNMGHHEDKPLQSPIWSTIPTSSKTDVQSRTTSKLRASSRKYLVQWSASHSYHITVIQQLEHQKIEMLDFQMVRCQGNS